MFVCSNVSPALFPPRASSPPTLPHLAEQALEELQAEDLHWGLFKTGQQGQAEVCSRWQYSLNEYILCEISSITDPMEFWEIFDAINAVLSTCSQE